MSQQVVGEVAIRLVGEADKLDYEIAKAEKRIEQLKEKMKGGKDATAKYGQALADAEFKLNQLHSRAHALAEKKVELTRRTLDEAAAQRKATAEAQQAEAAAARLAKAKQQEAMMHALAGTNAGAYSSKMSAASGVVAMMHPQVEKLATATSGLASVFGGVGAKAGAAFGATSNLAMAFATGGWVLPAMAAAGVAIGGVVAWFDKQKEAADAAAQAARDHAKAVVESAIALEKSVGDAEKQALYQGAEKMGYSRFDIMLVEEQDKLIEQTKKLVEVEKQAREEYGNLSNAALANIPEVRAQTDIVKQQGDAVIAAQGKIESYNERMSQLNEILDDVKNSSRGAKSGIESLNSVFGKRGNLTAAQREGRIDRKSQEDYERIFWEEAERDAEERLDEMFPDTFGRRAGSKTGDQILEEWGFGDMPSPEEVESARRQQLLEMREESMRNGLSFGVSASSAILDGNWSAIGDIIGSAAGVPMVGAIVGVLEKAYAMGVQMYVDAIAAPMQLVAKLAGGSRWSSSVSATMSPQAIGGGVALGGSAGSAVGGGVGALGGAALGMVAGPGGALVGLQLGGLAGSTIGGGAGALGGGALGGGLEGFTTALQEAAVSTRAYSKITTVLDRSFGVLAEKMEPFVEQFMPLAAVFDEIVIGATPIIETFGGIDIAGRSLFEVFKFLGLGVLDITEAVNNAGFGLYGLAETFYQVNSDVARLVGKTAEADKLAASAKAMSDAAAEYEQNAGIAAARRAQLEGMTFSEAKEYVSNIARSADDASLALDDIADEGESFSESLAGLPSWFNIGRARRQSDTTSSGISEFGSLVGTASAFVGGGGASPVVFGPGAIINVVAANQEQFVQQLRGVNRVTGGTSARSQGNTYQNFDPFRS